MTTETKQDSSLGDEPAVANHAGAELRRWGRGRWAYALLALAFVLGALTGGTVVSILRPSAHPIDWKSWVEHEPQPEAIPSAGPSSSPTPP